MAKGIKTHVKLDIEVTLLNLISMEADEYPGKFIIKMKFLDIDKRFNADRKKFKSILYYNEKESFFIKSEYTKSDGVLSRGILYLPLKSNIGKELRISFNSDKERYEYLKRMYKTIKKWADDWYGFGYDGDSNLIISENRWIVYCENPFFYNLDNMPLC